MSEIGYVGVVNKKGEVAAIYVHWSRGIEDKLVHHYKDPKKVKQMIKLGEASYIGETLEPSEVVRRFGFSGRFSDEFKKLPREEQKRLEKDDDSEAYSLFYGRDRGEKGVGAIRFSSIERYYKDTYNDNSYLFYRGEWCYVRENGVLETIDGGSYILPKKNVIYPTREEARQKARIISQLIKEEKAPNTLDLYLFKDRKSFLVMNESRLKQVEHLTNDNRVRFPLELFLKDGNKPKPLKEIEDIIYNHSRRI